MSINGDYQNHIKIKTNHVLTKNHISVASANSGCRRFFPPSILQTEINDGLEDFHVCRELWSPWPLLNFSLVWPLYQREKGPRVSFVGTNRRLAPHRSPSFGGLDSFRGCSEKGRNWEQLRSLIPSVKHCFCACDRPSPSSQEGRFLHTSWLWKDRPERCRWLRFDRWVKFF